MPICGPDIGTITKIKNFDLEVTCSAFPESYDVFRDNNKIGHLYLRRGWFGAYIEGENKPIYTAEPYEQGFFADHERMRYLTEAIDAIENAIN
jgi:hypothetical protein